MRDRYACVLGRLIVTTVNQAVNGPRIDGALVRDAEGRRYQALVFGTGRTAPVVGWRTSGPGPRINRWPRTAARLLQPAARFLFAMRPTR